jgi:hypothetical protein
MYFSSIWSLFPSSSSTLLCYLPHRTPRVHITLILYSMVCRVVSGSWQSKTSATDKCRNERIRRQQRRRQQPTILELRTHGCSDFLTSHPLSPAAHRRLEALVNDTCIFRDTRDHRRVPKPDRLPRSLESHLSASPPNFWVLDIPALPPMLDLTL